MSPDTQHKYPETKFKSAYWLGDKLLNFFLNFREETQSFSFIIKKGAYSTIYNLTSEERLPLVRTMIRELPASDLLSLKTEIEQLIVSKK